MSAAACDEHDTTTTTTTVCDDDELNSVDQQQQQQLQQEDTLVDNELNHDDDGDESIRHADDVSDTDSSLHMQVSALPTAYHDLCDLFHPQPFDAQWCHMSTAIKHPMPGRVKPSFVIFDIRALWRSVLSVRVPGCQKLQMTA